MWIKSLIWIVLYIYPGLSQYSGSYDSIPCEKGWFYFSDKCYKLGGKKESGRLKRDQAAEKCVSEGGHLVTIGSKEVQEFLVTFFLLDAKTSLWLGLHDQINESKYLWDDGSAVDYTNWQPNEPSGEGNEGEDCVEMVYLYYQPNYDPGQWNDNLCSNSKAYICESNTSRKSSPDPRFCSSGGWKHMNSCYHVISEIKSWDNAEQDCQNTYNGHLITILDHTVEHFLQYILSRTDRDLWIGIKIQEQSLQKWESGWFVSYRKWGKDESEDFALGTCALRSKQKSWKKVSCSKKYSFICEAPSVGPPRLKQPVKDAKCPEQPEDWWDLGGEYCYFFDMNNKVNWYKANMECIRRGGSLVSIHSKEESDILNKFIIYSQNVIHIGLVRLKAHEDVFMWTDGSRMDYKNWNFNEPNREYEKCGEMFTENMKWNDATCDSNNGYICSVKKVLPNVTQQIEQCSCTMSPNVTPQIKQVEKIEEIDCTSSLSFKATIAVSVSILVVIILVGCVIYCCRTREVQHRRMSSENQLQLAVPTPQRPRFTRDIITKDDDECYDNVN